MLTTSGRQHAVWGLLLEVNETHQIDDHHDWRPPQGDSATLQVHSPLAEL